MKNTRGRFQFTGAKPNLVLVKEMQEQLEKWVHHTRQSLCIPYYSTFKINVDQNERFAGFQIFAQIEIGLHKWKAIGQGETISESFSQALKSLTPVSALSRAVSDPTQ